jgi:hypothetical protein
MKQELEQWQEAVDKLGHSLGVIVLLRPNKRMARYDFVWEEDSPEELLQFRCLNGIMSIKRLLETEEQDEAGSEDVSTDMD